MSTATAPPAIPEQSLPAENWRKRYPALARFFSNKVAVAALCMIVILLLTALCGPLVYRTDPGQIHRDFVGSPQPVDMRFPFPFGSDGQGRDMLARLLAGSRISLAVGLVSACINLIIGIGVGLLAGWANSTEKPLGGLIDMVIMRGIDILQSIPLLLVVVLLQLFVKPAMDAVVGGRESVPLIFSPDLVSIYLALGVINWLTMARLTRGEVINQARMDYVMAARSLGQSNRWIMIKHVLPNCLGPLAVAVTLAIPEAIFVESFLAFVGIGVTAPQASWGTMASDGLSYLGTAPHLLILPAIAISVTMLAFNLFGDGLRDALDPSKR